MCRLVCLQPNKSKGITPGSRGVIVSCMQGREVKSGREAVSILAESLEDLKPPNQDDNEAQHNEAEKGNDISALIASEVADLKDVKKRDFVVKLLGIASLLYVECNYDGDPSPSELVDHALRRAKETGQNKAKLCNRFYPVEYSCAATIEEINTLADKIAKDHFETEEGKGVKVRVWCDAGVVACRRFARLEESVYAQWHCCKYCWNLVGVGSKI